MVNVFQNFYRLINDRYTFYSALASYKRKLLPYTGRTVV